ncbi:hypothetical protein BX667DRAFT_361474 [Coemansia mojavensis]|nr:hypothetical protein BX667DRAFT_361474 [Coemansia mojavensis]
MSVSRMGPTIKAAGLGGIARIRGKRLGHGGRLRRRVLLWRRPRGSWGVGVRLGPACIVYWRSLGRPCVGPGGCVSRRAVWLGPASVLLSVGPGERGPGRAGTAAGRVAASHYQRAVALRHRGCFVSRWQRPIGLIAESRVKCLTMICHLVLKSLEGRMYFSSA